MAATGVAAINIDDTPIHTALNTQQVTLGETYNR